MLFNRNNDDNTNNSKRQPLHPIAGLWSGVGELFNDPGTYYVQANYRGNGLANTGLGYLANPYSRDYASAGQALAAEAALRRGEDEQRQNQFVQNALWKLSNLSNRAKNWITGLNRLGDFGQYGKTNNIINDDYRIV